jgi:uracil-DNA glycosylase
MIMVKSKSVYDNDLEKKKRALFHKIKGCHECSYKYGETPFFFPMTEQKVMLITACPSIQAMFRPLTSIRFFRTICNALFGDASISPEYVEAIHDKVYWTHMQKCYNEEALKSGEFDRIPDRCRKVYIEEEISLLKPEIIIAFGGVVAERLFKYELSHKGYNDMGVLQNKCLECSKWGAKVFITDFPKTGLENRFDIIRYVLSNMPGFDFMKRHKNEKWTSDPINNNYDTSKGLRVNFGFERKTVEMLKQIKFEKATDDHWIENVVLPNMKNCDSLASLEFFVEDQIRTLLMEVFSYYDNWFILEDLKLKELTTKRPLTQFDVYKFLERRWTDAFRDYLIYLLTVKNWNVDLPDGRTLNADQVSDLSVMLKELSGLRNCIVHNGSYSPPKHSINRGATRFQGIRRYVNLVYVSDEGIKSIVNFVEEITSILFAHDKMRFG